MIFILVIGGLIRIILSGYGTYYNDLYAFSLWSLDLIRYGFNDFYDVAKSDYLPGYLYILWFTGKVFYFLNAHAVPISVELAYKLPSIFADLINTVLIFLIIRNFGSVKKSILVASVYLFNPALTANSSLWGQNDSFVTLFLLLSFYLLISKKYSLSYFTLGFGYLVKPILLFCLPIYLLYLFLSKVPVKNISIYLVIFLSTVLILFIPFKNSGNFFQFLIERHFSAISWFPYTTLNAFNFWASLSTLFYGTIDFVSDQNKFLTFTLRTWGYLLFITSYLVILITFIKKFRQIKNNKKLLITYFLSLITLIYFSMFLFLTQIRERHLYYALTLLIPLIAIYPIKKWIIFIPLYLNYGFSLYYSFLAPSQTPLILNSTFLIFFSFLNIFYFVYLFRYFLKTNVT